MIMTLPLRCVNRQFHQLIYRLAEPALKMNNEVIVQATEDDEARITEAMLRSNTEKFVQEFIPIKRRFISKFLPTDIELPLGFGIKQTYTDISPNVFNVKVKILKDSLESVVCETPEDHHTLNKLMHMSPTELHNFIMLAKDFQMPTTYETLTKLLIYIDSPLKTIMDKNLLPICGLLSTFKKVRQNRRIYSLEDSLQLTLRQYMKVLLKKAKWDWDFYTGPTSFSLAQENLEFFRQKFSYKRVTNRNLLHATPFLYKAICQHEKLLKTSLKPLFIAVPGFFFQDVEEIMLKKRLLQLLKVEPALLRKYPKIWVVPVNRMLNAFESILKLTSIEDFRKTTNNILYLMDDNLLMEALKPLKENPGRVLLTNYNCSTNQLCVDEKTSVRELKQLSSGNKLSLFKQCQIREQFNDKRVTDNEAFLISQGLSKKDLSNCIHLLFFPQSLVEKWYHIVINSHTYKQSQSFQRNNHFLQLVTYLTQCDYLGRIANLDDFFQREKVNK